MAQYLPLPDGSYLKLQEGESPAAGLQRAQQKYPEAFAPKAPAPKPEGGFLAAAKAGATELGGGISALMGKVGLKDEAKAEAEYQAAKKRAAEIFKPTEEGWTEAPFTKFKELLGGSVPYMAAPLAAGAAAAALPVTGTAAALTTLGAAGLTSAGQFTATNLARQMEEGKKIAETDLGAAALAAVPQAALDTLSMRMIPGIGRIFGQAGVKITAANAKEIAEQGLKKTLADYAAKTGKTAGIEGITEATQQVFERLQAGLNIADPQARQEYFDSFIGGAVLGGTLAPVGRAVERGGEKREARGLLEKQAQEERAAAAKAEEERKKQPEYLLGLDTQYNDAVAKMRELQTAVKQKPAKDADPAQWTEYNQKVAELKEFTANTMRPITAEYTPRKAEIAKVKEQRRVAGMTPEDVFLEQMGVKPPTDTGPATLEEAALLREEAPPALAPELAYANDQLDYAKRQGELQTLNADEQRELNVGVLVQDPGMAQQLLKSRPSLPGMNRKESDTLYSLLKLQLDKLGGDIAAGREAAGYERKQTDIEQQVAREQAARLAATQQQLELEGTAEREAMQGLAADRASDMRARELGALRTAPQLAMFPEEQAPTTRVGEGTPPAIPAATELEAGFKQFFTEPAPARTPETTQRDVRPQEPLTQRLDTLAARILAAPNVDDATKDLVQQVQGNLPEVAAQLRAQTEALSQRAPQRGVAPRVTPRSMAQGDELAQVADWAQSVLQGRASPEMTSDIRAAVQALEAGKRSETEQATQYAGRALTQPEQQQLAGTSLEGRQGVMTREPTGEVRRAVQTEIAMPEPTAKAFESFGAFNDFLASEGLQAYRTQKGLVFPTLANLQRRLAPIQARVQELQTQLDDVNAKRNALQKADAAERGAASELLRESQQRLQATVKSLDDTARTAYVGQKLKKVDLVDLLDEAHGRLNAALAHSSNLRNQLAQALGNIASAEEAAKPIMVDANGNATTNEKAAVKTVARGQLPGYQALRKAQLDMQAKGNALVAADEKLGEVVRAGIGQSWETGSPTLTAYLRAKKAKDEAQRAARQAHFAMLQAYKRTPSTEVLNNNFSKFLTEKETIDAEMAKAAKSLSAIRLGVRNASNRLNDAYVRAENNPDLRFGENLMRLRQDLLAAQNISEEAMGRSVERQAQVGELAKEAKGIAEPMRKQQAVIRGVLANAQERAAQRQAKPPVETQTEREAKDAEKRREEQARLERQEAIPATRIEFERAETDNQETRTLLEAVADAPSTEARAAARKTLDEHLKALVVRKDAELDDMKRRAAKNVQDLNTQRKVVAELTERLKGDLTPKRKESAEKQLAEAKRKMAEHERRYTLNTREMKIKRTDIQAQREERNRLLAEASGRRVEGERLGVAEGTQQRAIGPVTRAEVIPPKALRTESPESRAGVTATDTRQKLTEARGEKQRDVAIKASEQAEANRIAEALKKQTPEQKAAAAKEEAAVQKEQAKLQPKPAKVTPLRSEKPARLKGEVISESVEEDFEPELLGGPEEDVYFTAKRPPMSADARQAVRVVRDAAGMPSIDSGRPDNDYYRVSGFQPDTSAPFHKMTLADAARFGASKARGQRKELFTRLADLFDEATTPEKQGLVFATNGRGNPEGAAGAFYRKSNVVFTPSTSRTNYLETLLHELTHAASWYALSVDKRLAGRVESLRRKAAAWAETKEGKEYVRKHAFSLITKDTQGKRGIYGLKNIDEFLSELYADREFQKFLTQIPSDAPKKNLFTRFVEFMSSFFSAPDQAQQSLFAEAVALSEEVLETTRREIYGTDVALAGVQRSRLPFGAEGPPDVAFSAKLPVAARVADSLIAKEKGWLTKLKDNFLGMGGRTQFVDKLYPTEEALKRSGTDPTKALQAMYYLRMYDQRMHFTSQSITEGVPELVEKTRRDGTTERLIETKPGANIQQIVDILKRKDVVKAAGSPDAANKLFTLYLAARRAESKGYDKLNFKISEADIKAARAEIEADPTLKKAFDEARDIYNQYNRNLLEFSVQTGAISRAEANKYLSNNDYIPYYRMRDGVAEMVIGGETPIRIGNLKDSPHLKELVGGDEAIFDFLTSSVQNTSMLLDMATKNLAVKNLMFELRDVGLATVAKVPKSGKTPEGAVTFKRDGEDHYAVVDTDTIGINSELLVKGLAGIPTMFPAFVRVLGVPARLLRRVVVASPVYMARQLFRDSLAAAMTSGADITPVLGALKQIGKPNALQSRGITGGQVFTGMPEDVTRMLKDMQAGKISVTNGLSYLEAKAAQVDALTRKAQYESYLAQGLSEMEATYMALESMNFSKRGLSPTMHMVSTLIPFFNAQIQGLDVLYKAFAGKMPLNERLAIREKLWTRGLMLAGLSMAYALAMQDDETYKNAKPEEKYGNWFVQVPGFEQMVRLPIPFELGYIFKALPEALVNTLSNEQGGEEAMKAFKHIAQQMVPGASSYFLPQAVKPALETLIGTSLYTGRSIESTQEQMMESGYRYRDNTTEAAKFVGELTGFSPIKMEFLIRGYTGGMGMALLAALSAPFGGEGPEAATKRASDMPVVGTLFQPKDASGIIDATYERMKQVNQVKETYEGLLNKGRQADAQKYLKENIDEMALASVAGSFKQYMGQITEYERQIRASNMTPEKKREALDQARQAKIQLATSVRAAADRKAPQAVPA